MISKFASHFYKKEDKIKENGDASGYHLIVLAKNYNGYKNLIKLVSRAWVDGLYYKPRTDRADLEKFHEDLIVSSACIAGEVPAKILKGDMDGAREAIEWYKRVFGDDYYLELQRHEVKDPRRAYLAKRRLARQVSHPQRLEHLHLGQLAVDDGLVDAGV